MRPSEERELEELVESGISMARSRSRAIRWLEIGIIGLLVIGSFVLGARFGQTYTLSVIEDVCILHPSR